MLVDGTSFAKVAREDWGMGTSVKLVYGFLLLGGGVSHRVDLNSLLFFNRRIDHGCSLGASIDIHPWTN